MSWYINKRNKLNHEINEGIKEIQRINEQLNQGGLHIDQEIELIKYAIYLIKETDRNLKTYLGEAEELKKVNITG